MSVIDRIKNDQRVREVSDERGLGDGFWVYLKDGFCGDDMGCHIIHEDSPSACLKAMRYIQPCTCREC